MESLKKSRSLTSLLQGLTIHQLIGEEAVSVNALYIDSRDCKPAGLFIALQGTYADGHTYIPQAVEAGSVVVVCERMPDTLIAHVTYVLVADSQQALGTIASNFYEHPSTKLKLVAVTGTNGKTSTVHLLFHLFKKLGHRVGMLSTIHNQVHEESLPAMLTTPDAITIHSLLARMVAAGCHYCFMEASSHALAQGRMAELQLAGAVFLNITRDHLDYHKTFDAYIQAKKKLFDGLPANAFALYNADDKHGTVVLQNTHATPYAFALKSPAHFMAKLLTNTLQGVELRIAQQATWFQLVGAFNGCNILAAYATACLLGQDSDPVLVALSALTPIPGRFQRIHARTGFDAIVDYAHTPDALRNVLETIHQVKHTTGRVITVVGCGGDRDQGKRPLMARVACRWSDHVIFTTDNPRQESPQSIVLAMQEGLTTAQKKTNLNHS